MDQVKASQGYEILTCARKDSNDPSFQYCGMTYDLQQTIPKIPREKLFYLRQLWVYLGLHVCNNESGIMCMWPKNIASRSSCEIGSCLLKLSKH